MAGMVARVEPPDVPTRQAILKAKASARGVDVPEPVLAYIADHLRASIRELEGALCTVIAQAGLTGRRIDLVSRNRPSETPFVAPHSRSDFAMSNASSATCFRSNPMS